MSFYIVIKKYDFFFRVFLYIYFLDKKPLIVNIVGIKFEGESLIKPESFVYLTFCSFKKVYITRQQCRV